MSYLIGEERDRVREALLEALRLDGGWLTTRQAHERYYRHYGVDTRVGGWVWGLPDGVPWLNQQQVSGLLAELHQDGRVERKQRARLCTWFWRAAEPEPVPDTFPAEWTRDPVPA